MPKLKTLQRIVEFASDYITLIISNILALLVLGTFLHKIPTYDSAVWINYFIVQCFSFLLIFLLFPSSINLFKRSKSMEMLSCIRNNSLIFTALGVMMILTKTPLLESRYLFFGTFIINTLLSFASRFVLKRAMIKNTCKSVHASQTGIITTSDLADDFVTALKTDWTKNIKAIALLDTRLHNGSYKKYKRNVSLDLINETPITTLSETEINSIQDIPVVANLENLIGWIKTASLDEVYIHLPSDNDEFVAEIVEELEDMGITVNITVPSLMKLVDESKFDNISCNVKAGYPMAVFAPAVHSEMQLILKHLTDFAGGLIGSIVSLPIILAAAIPLKLESPGPLIFKQQRIGKNGRIFNIYKLRSMYIDADERKAELMEQNKMDGLMFKMDNDPRITKVGKFIRKYSIDELPQFWNVLKGDMSLVGTRPPTIDEFEQYESHHKRRLSLKPGITGIWQVSGRSNIQDFEEVVKLDCEYIDNWSLWLDIKILFKTVGVVLKHEGAE